MSNQRFPVLPLTKASRPRPFFATNVQSTPTGSEYRVANRPVAGYRISLTLQLRSWLGEDATLFGFFEAHGGMRDSFIYAGTDGIDRRVRFDVDDLDDLDYEGGVYIGTIDLVTVVG